MVLWSVCYRFWWHAVNSYSLSSFSHCSATVLLSSRMDTPELLLTLPHKHTHARTLSLTPNTHRAISNQSQWLLCSSLNGGPDLRYAELFPPSPNFQATRGKKGMRKMERTRAWYPTFSLQTFNSFHLASQFTGSWDRLLCNEKVGWRREWSLLREQPSALTVALRWNCQNAVFLSHFYLLPSYHYSLNCHCRWKAGSYSCHFWKYYCWYITFLNTTLLQGLWILNTSLQ